MLTRGIERERAVVPNGLNEIMGRALVSNEIRINCHIGIIIISHK